MPLSLLATSAYGVSYLGNSLAYVCLFPSVSSRAGGVPATGAPSALLGDLTSPLSSWLTHFPFPLQSSRKLLALAACLDEKILPVPVLTCWVPF